MKKVLQIHLTEDLWEWLKMKKEKNGTSAAETIRTALREYIKKQEQKSQ